ncbi:MULTISPECIES: TerD family protein [Modicisalibacter]|uniref:TerD family protein n=1 Tax=Modicisalibacter TaxID=574347 RepID=UPI00100BE160|nr:MULTISPECIES: TerD family protein [Halomonadaceae]MBZ9559132.1 TerD family protein [Modicisalibacter sp. R2A 31.J]MBZ9576703.1 TerD family protein [Modicisalibacter sp. MOD 31.J]
MIDLSKGSRINLSKEAPGATKFTLGMGWDTRITDGADFDLDASALLLDANDQPVGGTSSLVFYGQLASPCGGVASSGDNRTGEGDGDDETITVDLTQLNADIAKIVLVVTIHEADARGQNFGMVNNAFVRILKDGNDEPVARYDLSEDYSTETAVIFGELYKKDGDWRFAAKGDGFAGGLAAFLKGYGLQ